MGLLRGIFGKAPEKELERAVRFLENGDSEKALTLAQKLVKKGDGPLKKEAGALVDRAMDALAHDYLERAGRAHEIGAWPDVLEWTAAALPWVRDLTQKRKLEAQIAHWRQQGFPEPEPEPEIAVNPPEEQVEEEEVDPEIHYLTLIGMLEPPWSDHYETLAPSFQHAYIAFNTGQAATAKALLDQLIETDDEPVFRLERARCLLHLDQPEEAKTDLEAVWPHFGDELLDSAGNLSVPGLWADAMLRLNRPIPVIEKLADLAKSQKGAVNLALHFGLALEMAEHFEDAALFLARAARRFEGRPLFPYALARVLNHLGDWEQAVEFLEKSIAPSCAGGACGAPPKHLPSLRFLAKIYLDNQSQLARARELINHIAQALNGDLTAEDQLLLAAYYRETGDLEAAQKAEQTSMTLLTTRKSEQPSDQTTEAQA